MELHNLDELYDITLNLSEKAYDPDSSIEKEYTFLEDTTDFPVLLYKDNNTLFVAFRGTNTDISTFESLGNSISNILTDIGTTDPLGLGNYLSYYDTFKFFIKGEYLGLKAHEGFIKVLDKIYFDLRKKIDDYDCSDIILTGHSAGGGSVHFSIIYMKMIDAIQVKQNLLNMLLLTAHLELYMIFLKI